MTYTKEHIWIIGASSGIGEALAKELHAQGASLILSARSEDKLNALNEALGEAHDVVPMDVTDHESVEHKVKELDAAYARIDRVIFLAGTYEPMDVAVMDMEVMMKTVDINLMGALYVVHAVLPVLRAQDGGQLAICASVAGYRGLPGGQPYCATKAALINLTESIRLELGDVLDVKLICPGFVKTPLTDKNDFTMPMMISPEKAAKAIAKGLTSRNFEIHFPKGFTRIMKLLELLPARVYFWVMKRMNLQN